MRTKIILVFVMTLISFLKAEEYSVPLYDSPLVKGYWQLVGIGSFSKAIQDTDETDTQQTLSDETDNDEIPTLGIIENNGFDYLDNPSTETLVKLTVLSDVDVDEAILYVESTENIYYADIEPYVPLFLKTPNSDDAIIRIDFKSSLTGKSFRFKTITNEIESQYYSAVFSSNSVRNNPIEAIPEITEVEDVTIEDFNKTKSIESIFDADLSSSEFEPLGSASELKIYQYKNIGSGNEWFYHNSQNTGDISGNDFTELESGYGYWFKLNKSESDLSKISGIRLDDVGYTLSSSVLPSLVEYYFTFLSDGWNLVTLPDSTIWNISTGFVVELNTSVSTNKTLKIAQRDGKEKLVWINTDVNYSIEKVAQQINNEISKVDDLNIRAFATDSDNDLSLDSLLLIGDSSFSIFEVDQGAEKLDESSDDNYKYVTLQFKNSSANPNNKITIELNTTNDSNQTIVFGGDDLFTNIKNNLESLELNSSEEFNTSNGASFLDVYLLKESLILRFDGDLDLNIDVSVEKITAESDLFTSVKSIYSDEVILGTQNNITTVSNLTDTGVSTILSDFGYFLKVEDNNFLKTLNNAKIKIGSETAFNIATNSDIFDLSVIAENITSEPEDLELKSLLVDTNFDGQINYEDMILLTNEEPFTIAEYTHFRRYKIDEDAIEEDIESSSELENKIYIQEIPVVIDTSSETNKTQALKDSIESRDITNLKIDIESDDDKNYLILSLSPDIGTVMTKPLKAYTSTANKNKMPILIPDRTIYGGIFSKLVTVFEMAKAQINTETNILSIPFGRNPTTNKISIESYSTSNALSLFTRSGFAIGKIMTANTDIDTGLINWSNLDLTVSSENWFDTNENMFISKTEKEKAYWVHLTDIKTEADIDPSLSDILVEWAIYDIAKFPGVDKEDDPYSITIEDADIYFDHNVTSFEDIPEYVLNNWYLQEKLFSPFKISDEVSFNTVFEHYYNIKDGTSDNVFSASVTVKVDIETENSATENIFGYIMFGNRRVDLIKSTAGDQFTAEIRGYEIGDIRGISSAEVHISDGYGNFFASEISLNLTKPSKPIVSIGDYNSQDTVITINADDNITKYFRVYQTLMDDDDETINQIEYEGNETNISLTNGIPKSYVWGEDQDITLYIVATDKASIENAQVSDIVEISYAPLYCGTNKLTSETDVTTSIPEVYLDECILEENSSLESTGIELLTISGNTIDTETTSLFYRALEDVSFSNSVPIYMFVGVNGSPVARIKFVDDYLGRVFYFWYDDKVYKGVFGEDFDSQTELYELAGGNGDFERGKQVYPAD